MKLGMMRFTSCVFLVVASMWLMFDLLHNKGNVAVGIDIVWIALNIFVLTVE